MARKKKATAPTKAKATDELKDEKSNENAVTPEIKEEDCKEEDCEVKKEECEDEKCEVKTEEINPINQPNKAKGDRNHIWPVQTR